MPSKCSEHFGVCVNEWIGACVIDVWIGGLMYEYMSLLTLFLLPVQPPKLFLLYSLSPHSGILRFTLTDYADLKRIINLGTKSR